MLDLRSKRDKAWAVRGPPFLFHSYQVRWSWAQDCIEDLNFWVFCGSKRCIADLTTSWGLQRWRTMGMEWRASVGGKDSRPAKALGQKVCRSSAEKPPC